MNSTLSEDAIFQLKRIVSQLNFSTDAIDDVMEQINSTIQSGHFNISSKTYFSNTGNSKNLNDTFSTLHKDVLTGWPVEGLKIIAVSLGGYLLAPIIGSVAAAVITIALLLLVFPGIVKNIQGIYDNALQNISRQIDDLI